MGRYAVPGESTPTGNTDGGCLLRFLGALCGRLVTRIVPPPQEGVSDLQTSRSWGPGTCSPSLSSVFHLVGGCIALGANRAECKHPMGVSVLGRTS